MPKNNTQDEQSTNTSSIPSAHKLMVGDKGIKKAALRKLKSAQKKKNEAEKKQTDAELALSQLIEDSKHPTTFASREVTEGEKQDKSIENTQLQPPEGRGRKRVLEKVLEQAEEELAQAKKAATEAKKAATEAEAAARNAIEEMGGDFENIMQEIDSEEDEELLEISREEAARLKAVADAKAAEADRQATAARAQAQAEEAEAEAARLKAAEEKAWQELPQKQKEDVVEEKLNTIAVKAYNLEDEDVEILSKFFSSLTEKKNS